VVFESFQEGEVGFVVCLLENRLEVPNGLMVMKTKTKQDLGIGHENKLTGKQGVSRNPCEDQRLSVLTK
jgi:hypothetical protein